MSVLFVIGAYLLPLALLVAAVVWAVNLSTSVLAIQRILERMEGRQSGTEPSSR